MSLSYHIPNFVSIGQIFHHSCRSFCGEACPAITVAHYQCVFFCLFFSPASLLFLSSTILWMAEAAGGEKTTEADVTSDCARDVRGSQRCFVNKACLNWQLYGKRSGNLFNVFFISKNRFSDIKRYLLISENRFFDFLISKKIFWYQNIDFFISKTDFLISEIDFLISENIFWYQKYFWYKKWKSFLISKSKSYFLISKKWISDIRKYRINSHFARYFFYIKNIE